MNLNLTTMPTDKLQPTNNQFILYQDDNDRVMKEFMTENNNVSIFMHF